jgi:plastocyanin
MLASFNRNGAQNGELRLRARLTICLIAALCSTAHGSYAQATPNTHIVIIEAMQFDPTPIEVTIGDTVTWKNKDAFPHTVTAENRSFDSGDIATNGSWKFKASKKGVFPYVCSLHPTMKATLVVK